jgi:hypothetical protein
MVEMAFWFYESWAGANSDPRKTARAVIHCADCGYCNHGAGCHGAPAPGRGQWHGPFQTLDDAQLAADATEKPVRQHRCVLANGADES